MTKKDYEKAATIVRERLRDARSCTDTKRRGEYMDQVRAITYAFIDLFVDDNPRFDKARFIAATEKG